MDEPILNTQISHYLILERVKAGGVAIVYKARDVRDNQIVAFKILQENWSHHGDVVQRFQREARIMGHLKHPHIITLFDEGMYQNRPYIVMEFMAGGSLSERLKRSNVISLGGASKLLLQIASALDFAHAHDVIHRDLKPGNILMKDSNHAILTDFGIAWALSEQTALTNTGQMPGTPNYMSPEQAKGDLNLTSQSDQYSLGIIAYLMATGRLPFTGTDANVMIFQHLNKVPDTPSDLNPDIPPALDDVIMRSMDKNPHRRYANIEDFARAFADAVKGYEDVQVQIGSSRTEGDVDASKVFDTHAPLPPHKHSFEYAGALPSSDNKSRSQQPQQGGLSARFLIGAVGMLILLGVGAFVGLNMLNRNSEEVPVIVVVPTDEPTYTPTASQTPTFTETVLSTFTETPTDTNIPTATETETPSPTATATETASYTPTEQPTETLVPTETVTFTPTITPTATPLFLSWQSALFALSEETGTPGRFNCERFVAIYDFLLNENMPHELLTLLQDVNSPIFTIYTSTCQNSPDNTQAYIESVLYQDMRNMINGLLQ